MSVGASVRIAEKDAQIQMFARRLQCEILCIIPTLTRNDAVRRSALHIHLAEIACKLLRYLECREVSAFIVLGRVHELSNRVRPPS